jgi:hypothetical protein
MAHDLQLIIHRAREMLGALASTTQPFAQLRPHDEDYGLVFVGDAALRARAGYAGLWQAPPPWPVRPEQTEIHVTAALAEDFARDDPRASPFPGGYKTIAAQLAPDQVWLLWEHVAPGQRDGIVFDGLVPIGDRWAWFPKPWRVVQPTD